MLPSDWISVSAEFLYDCRGFLHFLLRATFLLGWVRKRLFRMGQVFVAYHRTLHSNATKR